VSVKATPRLGYSGPATRKPFVSENLDINAYVPSTIGDIGRDHQTALPRIARDPKLTRIIDEALRRIPTVHDLYRADARFLDFVTDQSVHLVVCSPPYWTLKEYRRCEGQMGYIADYENFYLSWIRYGSTATGSSCLAGGL
jgi:hypothetical protein